MSPEKIKKICYSDTNYSEDNKGKIKKFSKSIWLHPHDHKRWFDWLVILFFLKSIDINPASVLELGGGVGNISYYYSMRGSYVTVEDICLSYIKNATNPLTIYW